jgi:hypothetical protein
LKTRKCSGISTRVESLGITWRMANRKPEKELKLISAD